MPDRRAHPRAQAYLQRSRVLSESAVHEFRDEGRRRDLAATYQRVADAMAPQPPRELLIEHLRGKSRKLSQ